MSEQYKASDELSFAIKMTQASLTEQHGKVLSMVADLSDVQNWIDGHVAEEVARLSGLVTQLHTMRQVMRMLHKQELEKQG